MIPCCVSLPRSRAFDPSLSRDFTWLLMCFDEYSTPSGCLNQISSFWSETFFELWTKTCCVNTDEVSFSLLFLLLSSAVWRENGLSVVTNSEAAMFDCCPAELLGGRFDLMCLQRWKCYYPPLCRFTSEVKWGADCSIPLIFFNKLQSHLHSPRWLALLSHSKRVHK